MSTFKVRCDLVNSLFDEIEFLEKEHRLRLTPTLWDRTYLAEAVECFCNSLFVSCVIVASALVERCLYWEWVRREPRFQETGATLTQRTLTPLFQEFYGTDIPVDLLVDKEEPIDWFSKKKQYGEVRYIQVRNKFSHCDILDLSRFLPMSQPEHDDYGIEDRPPLESVAYIQLLKTLRFMKQFTKVILEKYVEA